MLRASEFYRVRHCLASVRLSEEVRGTPQEAPVGEEAERGTDEHKEFAAGNDSYMQHLAKTELEIWAHGHKYLVYNEKELYLRYEWLEPYFVGHPDRYAIRDDGDGLVIDFKTGPLLEIESWTSQLNCYWALIVAAHQDVGNPQLIVISKYHGKLQIPLSAHPDKTISEIFQLVHNLLPGWSRSPTPGRWCRYCPARLVCPEAPRAVEPYLNGSELPLGEDGAELLTRLHILAKLVKEKIKYYEDIVRKDPNLLASKWQVGKGKHTGEITSFTNAAIALSERKIDSRSMLEACAKLSYAKLRDFLAEANGLTKKDAEAALMDILGDLLVFKESEGSVIEVVPEITNESTIT